MRFRLRLAIPHADFDLRRLAALRRELGHGRFTGPPAQATSDTDLAEPITLLDQLDADDASGA